jgi:hypothetical protein
LTSTQILSPGQAAKLPRFEWNELMDNLTKSVFQGVFIPFDVDIFISF